MSGDHGPETGLSDDEDADLVVPIELVARADAEDVLAGLPEAQATWAGLQGFSGKLGEIVHLPGEDGHIDRVLFGWGDARQRRRDRFYLGELARSAPKGTYKLDADLDPDAAEEAVLGWLLGRYRFEKYKSGETERQADLIAPDGVSPTRLIRMVEGVFLTRDLINTAANDMGPSALEAAARRVAARDRAEISVITGEDLLAQNFPLIHTVGRAAADAPRLIEMTWGDPDAPAITLVGKGVCFDTGGLNLKPGASMGLMKKDMGGAATVLGLAHMVMGLNLPVRLRVLIPAVENAVSGNAMRPGDVLTSRSGRTVEINNTDAEGRLILADALSYAVEDPPELLIDMATLTGAARVALGPDLAPYYTNDDSFAAALDRAGTAAADPVWRMPLWPGYEREIEPAVADLDNAPKGGMAGSITAALFLQRFVDDVPWAHFDIYGWVPKARPGRPMGGDCQAARAILRVLEDRYASEGA